jgi:phosphonopyruvate decarboxylase
MKTRQEAIRSVFERHGNDAVYVTTTGYISRAVSQQYPQVEKHVFFMQGSMGLAPAIGLGMALSTKKEVVVINGDAAFLMHLGIGHTIRDCQCDNFFHYVLDNGCHESVGGYPCAPLESWYPGVTEIIKITMDGKGTRVSMSCEEISANLRKILH